MSIEALTEAQDTKYFCRRYEIRHDGSTQMPVASDGITESVTVRLQQPIEYIVIWFSVEKWGEAPLMPSPEDIENNAVFMFGWRAGDIPMPDQSLKGHYWKVEGVYVYARKNPVGLAADMPMGKTPFDTLMSLGDSSIPSGHFITGIVGQGPSYP